MGNSPINRGLKNLIFTRRGVTLCARSMGLGLFYGYRPCPLRVWGRGRPQCGRGWGRAPAAGGRFCLAQPVRFRGLKNKPKIRYFIPNFSLLFHGSRGRAGLFRALRSATNGLPLDHKKLSRKFYQSFQKRVQLNPSNSDLPFRQRVYQWWNSLISVNAMTMP